MNAKVHRGEGAPVVRLRWVYTDQPFLPLGTQSVINNRVWNEDQYSDLAVGQLPLVECNYKQDARWVLPAFKFDGHQCHPEWFAVGEPWPVPSDLPPTVSLAGWVPECCVMACDFEDCSRTPINGHPASQERHYPIPAVEAVPSTPFEEFQNALNQGDHTPAWPGFLHTWNPAGTVAAPGWSKTGVADNLGVPQFVEEAARFAPDNVITHKQDAGGDFTVIQNGLIVGALALRVIGTQPTLDGINVRLGFGLKSAAYEDVGVAGHTLPFLDGVNTWSGSQVMRASAAGVNPLATIALAFDDHSAATPLQTYATFAGNTAVGFGVAHVMGGKVGAVDAQTFHYTAVVLTDATFATWKARVYHYIGGATLEEYMSAAKLVAGAGVGFLGATPVARQAGDIGAALVAFGLMSGTPTYGGNAPTATLAANATKLQTARNINGVPFDGTADVTVYSQSATNTGQTVCAAFAVTGATGVYQATGSTIVLPAAGTYLVTASVRGDLQSNAAGYHSLQVQLRNNTAGAFVANTERVLAGTNVNGSYQASTAGVTAIITVGAASTLELYAARTGTGWAISTVQSDANGRSVLDWVRLF